MSEKQLLFILQRALAENVKVTIYTQGHGFVGYVTDIGDDYVKLDWKIKKKSIENFINLSSIESIETKWDK